MADYAKKLRQMRDTVEQSDSGMTRSDETKARLKNLDSRIKQSESAGAGRGGQGGPTAEQAAQNKTNMSVAEKQAREEMDFQKYAKETPEQKYAKGGSVFRASANGIAQRGKTKGKMVKMNYGGKC